MEKMKRGGEGGLKMEGTMWKRRGDVSSSSWVFSAAHSAEDVQEEQSRAEQSRGPTLDSLKQPSFFKLITLHGPLRWLWKRQDH